jgi:tryptophan synthase beta subunit
VVVNVSGRGDKDVETVRGLMGAQASGGGANGTH